MSTVIAALVPTRNRSALAKRAIRSLLEAGPAARLRIFVSDNSTSAQESEALRDFIDRECGAQVTLMQPQQPLPMVEHWEWALNQVLQATEVQSVVYLTDRMIARPDLFADAAKIAHQHANDIVSFANDVLEDDCAPIRFRPVFRSGKVFRVDSFSLLEASSRMQFNTCLPRMLNCFVPRKHLTDLRRRFGRVFSSNAPDFCFCFRTLQSTESFIYVDRSVVTSYGLSHSNGHSFQRGRETEAKKDFVAGLGGEIVYTNTPLPRAITVGNAIVFEYLKARSEFRDCQAPDVELQAYYDYLASECEELEDLQQASNIVAMLREAGWSPRLRLAHKILKRAERAALSVITRKFSTVDEALLFTQSYSAPFIPWLHGIVRKYRAVEIAD